MQHTAQRKLTGLCSGLVGSTGARAVTELGAGRLPLSS